MGYIARQSPLLRWHMPEILAFVGGGRRNKVQGHPSLYSESKGQPSLHMILFQKKKKRKEGTEEKRIWCLLPRGPELEAWYTDKSQMLEVVTGGFGLF